MRPNKTQEIFKKCLRFLEQQQRDNSRWKSESLNPAWYQGLSAHCATEDQVDRAHRQPTAQAEICQRLHKKKTNLQPELNAKGAMLCRQLLGPSNTPPVFKVRQNCYAE